MRTSRALLRQAPALAFGVAVFALLMRAICPIGFMPVMQRGVIAFELCPGVAPFAQTMALPGATHGHAHHHGHDDGKTVPCDYASLSLQGMASADIAILASAIIFIIMRGRRIVIGRVPRASPFLRPLPRGPPLTA